MLQSLTYLKFLSLFDMDNSTCQFKFTHKCLLLCLHLFPFLFLLLMLLSWKAELKLERISDMKVIY